MHNNENNHRLMCIMCKRDVCKLHGAIPTDSYIYSQNQPSATGLSLVGRSFSPWQKRRSVVGSVVNPRKCVEAAAGFPVVVRIQFSLSILGQTRPQSLELLNGSHNKMLSWYHYSSPTIIYTDIYKYD